MTASYKAGDRLEFDMGFKADTLDADVPDGYIKGIASTAKTDAYGHKVLAGAFIVQQEMNTVNEAPPPAAEIMGEMPAHLRRVPA